MVCKEERCQVNGIEEEEDNLDLIYALARLYNAEGEIARADEMIEEAAQEMMSDFLDRMNAEHTELLSGLQHRLVVGQAAEQGTEAARLWVVGQIRSRA